MRKRGSYSMLEYAVATACVVAALVSMQIYVKRGISGHLKKTVDTLGPQYDPDHTHTDYWINTTSDISTVKRLVEGDNTSYLVPVGGASNETYIFTETIIHNQTQIKEGREITFPSDNLWE